jgi:hypothetical protein
MHGEGSEEGTPTGGLKPHNTLNDTAQPEDADVRQLAVREIVVWEAGSVQQGDEGEAVVGGCRNDGRGR